MNATVRATVLAGLLCVGADGLHAAERPDQTPARTAPARAEAGGRVVKGTTEGRAWRLFVPSRLEGAARGEGNDRVPLVVALHGCWQTVEDFARGTRLDQHAERRGLLVLYPVQTRRDNPSRCWNWFDARHQARGAGEVRQILSAVAEVTRAYPTRREATIALGLSAGGFMALNLACGAPDLWAGVGVAAGGPYRCGLGVTGAVACMRGLGLDPGASATACGAATARRRRPLRASLWHGAADSVVSAENLPALATMFARLTEAVRSTTERLNGVERTVYQDSAGEPVVETWLVAGMGHAWSGGDPRGTHTFPSGPDATERMLDFLLPDTRAAASPPGTRP